MAHVIASRGAITWIDIHVTLDGDIYRGEIRFIR